MPQQPTSTLLFHLSDELRTSFSAPSDKRPAFYWFNDSYHSHILGDKPAYKYMYFFIVKPNSGVGLFTRHGKGDFASLWTDYLSYLDVRSQYRESGEKRYLEPAIVMSFSEMVPVLTGEFSDDYTLTISGASFNLMENGQFRRFDDIPELIALCPEIASSVPIIEPSSEQISSPESFWSADTANEGRSWL